MIVLPKVVNHQNAMLIRDQGLDQIAQKSDSVDATALVEFDSSMLAILLAWFRVKPDLKILHSPQKLQVLSQVYGLDELFILNKA
jgi:ABC-type transporter Mla MlaB component